MLFLTHVSVPVVESPPLSFVVSLMFLFLLLSLATAHPMSPQLIHSLHAVLDYGIANGIQDLNYLIGVAIARGQLSVTKDHNDGDESMTSELLILIRKSDILLESLGYKEDPLIQVLSPSLWNQDFPFLPLSTMPPKASPPFLPLRPLQSDSCLRSVFSSCSLPETCVWSEVEELVTGYSLTHQVLYWTIFDKKCKKYRVLSNVKALIKHKCGRILGEHLKIHNMGLPFSLQDLYFEQVVVCGLQGYLPFLSRSHQQTLLSLQTSRGCFSNSRQHPTCDEHLTGVAIAAAALLLRFELDFKSDKLVTTNKF